MASRADFEPFENEIRSSLEAEKKELLAAISAAELQQLYLPPVRFLVRNLIPAGLTILASPPKFGKSWAALDLCISVAGGNSFIGFGTNKSGCLYLALEDGLNRLKRRMLKLLDGRPAPNNLRFLTDAPNLDNGLIEQLQLFVDRYHDTGLIVIDTLQKIRGTIKDNNIYAVDYQDIGALKAFADANSIALVLVHHLNKRRMDGDPFNAISGTSGITGAADTMLVFSRDKRDDEQTKLSVTGRDVEAVDLILRFDTASCRWHCEGEASEIAQKQALQDYEENSIVQTVKAILAQNPTGWTGTMQQFSDFALKQARIYLPKNMRTLSLQLTALEEQLLNNDNIVHSRRANGSGGGKHEFRYL